MKAKALVIAVVGMSLVGCASNTIATADSKGVNVNLEPVASVAQPLPALEVGKSSVDKHGILGVEVNNGLRVTIPFVSLNLPLGKGKVAVPLEEKE